LGRKGVEKGRDGEGVGRSDEKKTGRASARLAKNGLWGRGETIAGKLRGISEKMRRGLGGEGGVNEGAGHHGKTGKGEGVGRKSGLKEEKTRDDPARRQTRLGKSVHATP